MTPEAFALSRKTAGRLAEMLAESEAGAPTPDSRGGAARWAWVVLDTKLTAGLSGDPAFEPMYSGHVVHWMTPDVETLQPPELRRLGADDSCQVFFAQRAYPQGFYDAVLAKPIPFAAVLAGKRDGQYLFVVPGAFHLDRLSDGSAGDWGDILYREEDTWKRLAIGTAGKVLTAKTVSGEVVPRWESLPTVPPATWSTTTAGILTTALQTGAGLKYLQSGTDGAPPGWRVTYTGTVTDARGGVFEFPFTGDEWVPYYGSWSFGQFSLEAISMPAASYAAPLELAGQIVCITNVDTDHSGEEDVIRSGAFSLIHGSDGLTYAVAGTAEPWPDADFRPHSFAVWREESGSPVFKPGLDDTVSACKVGVFDGGLLTEVVTPDTATPLATDYIQFCRDGTPYKCTFAALQTLFAELAVDVPPP